MSDYKVKRLPPNIDLETKRVLKKLNASHRYLAELKGVAKTIPNETILINTLSLQEAKDSSAVENIITTQDNLYRSQLFEHIKYDAATKEVSNYADALKFGFELVREHKILTISHIIKIQSILEQNGAGFRKVPGTALINQSTQKTVYTPPQDYDTIVELMQNFETYLNDPSFHDVDPLIKMAVLHFQFESIHPFYDGNGRTGRIINILYLVLQDLLDLPILYLSRFIIQNKNDYYKLLQRVRDYNEWEEWILYILTAIEETSKDTILLINSMKQLMLTYKQKIRSEFPKIYRQDLLNNLFKHPYTKIEFIMNDLGVKRLTAAKYLDILADGGLLTKQKIGRSNYYVNIPLFDLFMSTPQERQVTDPIATINPKIQQTN